MSRRYAPHNNARIFPLEETFNGIHVARSSSDIAHAEPSLPLIYVSLFSRYMRTQHSEQYGIEVVAFAAVEGIGRHLPFRVVVWGTDVRNEASGTYSTDPPSSESVEAAMFGATRALKTIDGSNR